jgi:hypothetical protein
VITLIEGYSNQVIGLDGRLPSGTITLISGRNLSFGEVCIALEAALQLKGLTVVDQGGMFSVVPR